MGGYVDHRAGLTAVAPGGKWNQSRSERGSEEKNSQPAPVTYRNTLILFHIALNRTLLAQNVNMCCSQPIFRSDVTVVPNLVHTHRSNYNSLTEIKSRI